MANSKPNARVLPNGNVRVWWMGQGFEVPQGYMGDTVPEPMMWSAHVTGALLIRRWWAEEGGREAVARIGGWLPAGDVVALLKVFEGPEPAPVPEPRDATVAALQARVRELEADLAKTREAWVDYGANGTDIIAGLRQELAAAVSRERELDAERGRLQGDLNVVSNRCMKALGDGNDRNRWREGEYFVDAVERMAVGARDAAGILHRILFDISGVPAKLIPDLYAARRALTGEK